MPVIADPTLHSHRLLAAEVALRTILIALVAGLILWMLPAIADAAA
jgi:hypothetical protein